MNYQASTQSNVKQKNQQIIFQILKKEGAMTRAGLAKKMNSSKPTISKNVDDLIRVGKLVEIGKDDNMVGKKGMLVDINVHYGYVLALDLSKSRFLAVISDLRENFTDVCSISLKNETMNEDKTEEVIHALQNFISSHQDISSKILQAVVSFSGVVGHNDELYLTNLKYKENIVKRLISFIKEDLGLPVSVKNDVNLAVLAEKKVGPFSKEKNIYLLSADTGVGVGIIINDQLYEGDRNAAGEVGFVLPVQNEEGRYMTLEEKVSLYALTERYRKLNPNSSSYEHGMNELSFEDLKEAIRVGERNAVDLYRDVIRDLSVTIANIASILDIRTVIVVGRLFDLSETMIEDINESILSMVPFETKVQKSVSERMSLKGAALIGVEKVIEEII